MEENAVGKEGAGLSKVARSRQQKAIRSPLKAILAFCLQCEGVEPGGNLDPVRNCTAGVHYKDLEPCPLFAFRLGSNPYAKRELTPEQRQAASERLAKARAS